MGLTADEAADVARRHGLGLHDAQALQLLADNPQDAASLAAKFGTRTEIDWSTDETRTRTYSDSIRAKSLQLIELTREANARAAEASALQPKPAATEGSS